MPVFRISFTHEAHQQRDVTATDLEEASRKIIDGEWDDQEMVAEWQGTIVRWDNAYLMEAGEENDDH